MAVIRLTDLAVRSLQEGVYFDERTPSFGLLVGKRRKTWLVVKGRGRVRVRLGHYPTLSLADARKKALVALGMPFEPVASPKFSEILETFLETHGPTLRPLSRYQLQRTLRRYFKWEKPLDKITHEDVATVIGSIAAKSEAAHALKDIRTFFNWCIPRYLSASPCAGLKKQSFKPRERVLTDDELVKVWRRADEIGHPYGTIVKLLILTGQRAGEIAALRWAWISDAALTLPAEITKNARATTIRLFAAGAPFEAKDALKGRAYRWSDGSSGARRAWWKDVPQSAYESELEWLRINVFHGRPIHLPVRQITARERYSSTLAI